MREAEDEAVDDARAGAEDYDRARDYEHLGRRAGYEALALELQSGGDHGVCKAGDGHQSARSAELRSVVIYAEAGAERAEEHQRHGAGRAGVGRARGPK